MIVLNLNNKFICFALNKRPDVFEDNYLQPTMREFLPYKIISGMS